MDNKQANDHPARSGRNMVLPSAAKNTLEGIENQERSSATNLASKIAHKNNNQPPTKIPWAPDKKKTKTKKLEHQALTGRINGKRVQGRQKKTFLQQ